MTPAQIAVELSETEKAYVLRTPLQEPADAGLITFWTGKAVAGYAFAWFAKRHPELIARVRNIPDTSWVYRLTPLGMQVRVILEKADG